MRDSVEIKGYGKVLLAPPYSLVTVNDLVSEYSGNAKNRAKLARLAAACLGVCWSKDNTDKPPIYDIASCEIVAYGGEMLEWLMKHKIDLASLYTETRPMFIELWEMIPRVEEVEAQAEYFQESGKP